MDRHSNTLQRLGSLAKTNSELERNKDRLNNEFAKLTDTHNKALEQVRAHEKKTDIITDLQGQIKSLKNQLSYQVKMHDNATSTLKREKQKLKDKLKEEDRKSKAREQEYLDAMEKVVSNEEKRPVLVTSSSSKESNWKQNCALHETIEEITVKLNAMNIP
mmetsp:Transcript_10421/g.12835  ORF Transcript_10421/g.12835 Transcript_10421/m.12835 type:complete len:161 (+) Transcript_10421:240-722(+)